MALAQLKALVHLASSSFSLTSVQMETSSLENKCKNCTVQNLKKAPSKGMRSIRIAIDPELDNNRGCWRDKTLGLVSVGWELRQNTLVI